MADKITWTGQDGELKLYLSDITGDHPKSFIDTMDMNSLSQYSEKCNINGRILD